PDPDPRRAGVARGQRGEGRGGHRRGHAGVGRAAAVARQGRRRGAGAKGRRAGRRRLRRGPVRRPLSRPVRRRPATGGEMGYSAPMALLDWMAEPVGPVVEGAQVILRPPRMADYNDWADLRDRSRAYLQRWEPAWP